MLAKVVKFEGDNKTIVWRHPITDFFTGTQLIVHESQEAVFVSDGRFLDTFSAGRYTLETANLPLISSVMKLATGGKNAFHCELYFVNLTEHLSVPWGTDSKIQYMDPRYGFPVQIGACGEMSLRIENSKKLLAKIVGTERMLTQDQLVEKLRVFVMKYAKSGFPKYIIDNNISVFELDMHLPEFSQYIQNAVADDFFDYGIDLVKFSVMTIAKPDEDRNYIKFKEIHYRKVNEIQEAELQQKLDIIAQNTKAQKMVIDAEAMARKRQLEGYSYQEEKAYEVAKEVAQNEAVGQMSNLGVGLGGMAGVGSSIGSKVSEITSGAMQQGTPRPAARFCEQCGHELSANAVFCEMCGTKVSSNKCAKCGAELSETARFCPLCGTRR